MAETRARPIIRAAAVWAVRRGLRMEFSRPSLPATPSVRASGRPITLASGRATSTDVLDAQVALLQAGLLQDRAAAGIHHGHFAGVDIHADDVVIVGG